MIWGLDTCFPVWINCQTSEKRYSTILCIYLPLGSLPIRYVMNYLVQWLKSYSFLLHPRPFRRKYIYVSKPFQDGLIFHVRRSRTFPRFPRLDRVSRGRKKRVNASTSFFLQKNKTVSVKIAAAGKHVYFSEATTFVIYGIRTIFFGPTFFHHFSYSLSPAFFAILFFSFFPCFSLAFCRANLSGVFLRN